MFALGFSLTIASFFSVAETKTLFGWRFGPLLAMALEFFLPPKKSIGLLVTSILKHNMLHVCDLNRDLKVHAFEPLGKN